MKNSLMFIITYKLFLFSSSLYLRTVDRIVKVADTFETVFKSAFQHKRLFETYKKSAIRHSPASFHLPLIPLRISELKFWQIVYLEYWNTIS